MENRPAAGTGRRGTQILLRQIGVRNAENTLYQNVLKQVSRNYADMTLADMTGDAQAGSLFGTEQTVPGMFTRRAWEGQVKEAIEQVVTARREEIDWYSATSTGRFRRYFAGSPAYPPDGTLLHRLRRKLADIPQ